MLTFLEVQQFALIDKVRIGFAPGFNVFTGETGAGKSILIDALGIVLGGRAPSDAVRTGADAYQIQAVFDVTGNHSVEALLSELGLSAEDGTLFLRRRVSAQGKSQAFVNDTKVPVKTLARLGALLVDIHGQHENQTLLRPGAVLAILHHYDPELAPTLKAYQEAFDAAQKGRETLSYWEGKNEHREEELARLEDELKEIDAAQIKLGEDDELRETVRRLSNQDKVRGDLSRAHELLSGVEGTQGVLDALTDAKTALSSAAVYDPSVEDLAQTLDSSWETLEDVRQTLSDRLSGDEDYRETLEEAQTRLDLLYHLKKKYGGSLEEILSYADRGRKDYEKLQSLQDEIDRLIKLQKKLDGVLQEKADELTKKRTTAAERFCADILPHLHDLAMPHAALSICFTKLDHCGKNGQDEATFLFSANAGMKPAPLIKIASGGELSRFALAAKTVLLRKFGVPTMIFDEIDTGVGGVTAQKMAEKMALIAKQRQVLCITHLAQIACFADQHLYIAKNSDQGMTASEVTILSRAGRIEEIMRMTSGTQQTESARENAKELLAMAEKEKQHFGN